LSVEPGLGKTIKEEERKLKRRKNKKKDLSCHQIKRKGERIRLGHKEIEHKNPTDQIFGGIRLSCAA
jgi:hypothetical protein